MGKINNKLRNSFRNICVITFILLNFSVAAGCQKPSSENFQIHTVPGVGALSNSYIIISKGEAAIIDPGDSHQIIAYLEDRILSPQYILLTHGHFDHIAGITEIIKTYPEAEILVHPADAAKLADPETNVSGIFGTSITVKVSTKPLEEGQLIKFGKVSIEVLETPGHTSGSLCFRLDDTIFSGDTVMQGSVGRTDFPDGNPEKLDNSLWDIMALPEDYVLLPGHGDPTTIGEELKSNPFLKNYYLAK